MLTSGDLLQTEDAFNSELNTAFQELEKYAFEASKLRSSIQSKRLEADKDLLKLTQGLSILQKIAESRTDAELAELSLLDCYEWDAKRLDWQIIKLEGHLYEKLESQFRVVQARIDALRAQRMKYLDQQIQLSEEPVEQHIREKAQLEQNTRLPKMVLPAGLESLTHAYQQKQREYLLMLVEFSQEAEQKVKESLAEEIKRVLANPDFHSVLIGVEGKPPVLNPLVEALMRISEERFQERFSSLEARNRDLERENAELQQELADVEEINRSQFSILSERTEQLDEDVTRAEGELEASQTRSARLDRHRSRLQQRLLDAGVDSPSVMTTPVTPVVTTPTLQGSGPIQSRKNQ